jgi:hypothetical protein
LPNEGRVLIYSRIKIKAVIQIKIIEQENVEQENLEQENIEQENIEQENIEQETTKSFTLSQASPLHQHCHTPYNKQ